MADEKDARELDEEEQLDSSLLDQFLSRLCKIDIPGVEIDMTEYLDEKPKDGAIRYGFGIEFGQEISQTEEGRVMFSAELDKNVENIKSMCKTTLESVPNCKGMVISHFRHIHAIDTSMPYNFVDTFIYFKYIIRIPSSLASTFASFP